jgi:hypothetical protein
MVFEYGTPDHHVVGMAIVQFGFVPGEHELFLRALTYR